MEYNYKKVTKMKTTKIIINQEKTKKDILTRLYENVCLQKELYEQLLNEYELDAEPAAINDEPRELIKGIKGLADYLGCGITKAQNIMNSGILQEREIAYRAGNRWRYNKTLLTELLLEDPEILNKIESKHQV